MSLITVAEQVQRRGALSRTLLTIVLVTAGIIGGLLAMHSLNIATGHGDTAIVEAGPSGMESVMGTRDADHGSAEPDTAAATAAGCADCRNGAAVAWMACVLALLAAVILLLPPALRSGLAPLGEGDRPQRSAWRARARSLPPPSLKVLCISRT